MQTSSSPICSVPALVSAGGVLLSGCADRRASIDAAVGADAIEAPDVPSSDAPFLRPDTGDAPASPDPVFVYAHTRNTLYRFEPATATLTRLGDFDCVSSVGSPSDTGDGMTDLAIDADGHLFGVGRTEPGSDEAGLVSVDSSSGRCRVIARVTLEGVGTPVQGLGFMPSGTLDPSADVLVGMGGSGEYFRIDPSTAVATRVATVEAPSDTRGGDFVAILGASAWIVSTDGTLVGFDPATGRTLSSTSITDPTMSDNIGMGLGFWGGTVYAFTYAGRILAIDTRAGTTTVVPTTGSEALSFRGAAVTTVAPLV